VLVRDVGSVREGAAIKRGDGSHNGRPAVILGIQKQPAVNTLDLTAQIDATLDDIQAALPAGMQIHRDLFRQADFIEQSLNNLFIRLLEGAALVTLVVVLFLMNGRAALITLLALPLSILAAVIVMNRFGLTINVMSLGGLAIAIGELVDDAIIDVENVSRRLRENATMSEAERRPVLDVVYRASTESAAPWSSPPSSLGWCSCRCSRWAVWRAGFFVLSALPTSLHSWRHCSSP
jgi:Cu/Ag efflux pump CusA